MHRHAARLPLGFLRCRIFEPENRFPLFLKMLQAAIRMDKRPHAMKVRDSRIR
jgi:hypothetical protein